MGCGDVGSAALGGNRFRANVIGVGKRGAGAMIRRLAIVALAVALASCAGVESAGRNARSSASTAPTRSAPAPVPPPTTAPALPPPTRAATTPPPQARAPLAVPPQQQQAAPVVAPAPMPTPTPPPVQRTTPPAPVAAPNVAVPTPAPTPAANRTAAGDDIIVSGQGRTQVPPPAGDPRSNEERRADVRAWDQCITQVQGAFDSDPMRPQLTTPEEYCAQSLGMAERNAVPVSRRQRR